MITVGGAVGAGQDNEQLLSVLTYSGSAYPSRPDVPDGHVRYIGPVAPSDWLSNDEWLNTSGTLAAPFQTFPPPRVGDWVTVPASAIVADDPANGLAQLGPLWLPAGTYDRAMFNVSTGGSSGAVSKVVVYADAAGRPDELLLDSSTTTATASGDKTITVSMVIPAGGLLVWAGTVSQGGATTPPTYSQVSAAASTKLWAAATPLLGFLTAPNLQVSGLTGAAADAPSVTSDYQYTHLAFRRGA